MKTKWWHDGDHWVIQGGARTCFLEVHLYEYEGEKKPYSVIISHAEDYSVYMPQFTNCFKAKSMNEAKKIAEKKAIIFITKWLMPIEKKTKYHFEFVNQLKKMNNTIK